MGRLISLTSLLVIGCLSTRVAIAQATCRPVDQYSTYLANKLTTLMSDSDPTHGLSRGALQLPLVATNEISIVADSLICSRALSAYNAALGPRGTGSTASTKVTVVKVGNDRYVVFDPDQMAGEYIYQVTLDGNYQVLAVTGT